VSRERLAWVSGVKQELLDFFVRQGISVSGEMVRVRQLGLCIDCKLCEEACEERYGARRLTLGGYQLGMLDFIYTCRTCTDQRCIDPCAYDSIKFDTDRMEVVINEATCTGCTACAQSCPYGAIDMVEIEPDAPTYKKKFKARLDKRDSLKFGPGTPRCTLDFRNRLYDLLNMQNHAVSFRKRCACRGDVIEGEAAFVHLRQQVGAGEAETQVCRGDQYQTQTCKPQWLCQSPLEPALMELDNATEELAS
jgi:Fe-S-cluster-containing hydrogenase component 2